MVWLGHPSERTLTQLQPQLAVGPSSNRLTFGLPQLSPELGKKKGSLRWGRWSRPCAKLPLHTASRGLGPILSFTSPGISTTRTQAGANGTVVSLPVIFPFLSRTTKCCTDLRHCSMVFVDSLPKISGKERTLNQQFLGAECKALAKIFFTTGLTSTFFKSLHLLFDPLQFLPTLQRL